MKYEVIASEGVERHICTYVPPQYRKMLRDMMSVFCYVKRLEYVTEKVSFDNFGVKEEVLQFHDLTFDYSSPIKDKQEKAQLGEPLSRLIIYLFNEFSFKESDWPTDLIDFVERLVNYDFASKDLSMEKHLRCWLATSERTSFIANLRDKRSCIEVIRLSTCDWDIECCWLDCKICTPHS